MPKQRRQQIQVVNDDDKGIVQVVYTNSIEFDQTEVPDRIHRLRAEITYLETQQRNIAERLEVMRQELALLEQFDVGNV